MTAFTPSRLIGLIGGLSWESTALYYRCLNETVRLRCGRHHSARCVVWSLDFEPLLVAAAAGRWQIVTDALIDAGLRLKAAGADFFLLAANTAHRNAGDIEQAVGLPLLHIAEATGRAMQRDGRRRVGLLGTRYVTESHFYADLLRARFAIDVVPPGAADRALLHNIIVDELTVGRIEARSRRAVMELIAKMQAEGLDGVIVACTELPLMVGRASSPALPCYDTTHLHTALAVDMAIAPSA